jgi:flagellin
MSSGFALSGGVRSALSSLSSTSSLQQTSQIRLATGKKVNSALDNPANFFTASGLNNRASDLNRLIDSIGQATKTLEAADKGLKAIGKLVEAAQGTARQALQSNSVNLTSTGSALVGGAAKVAVGADAGNLVVKVGGVDKTFAVAATDTVQTTVDIINATGTGLQAEVGTDNKLKITAQGGASLEIDATTTNATATFLGLTEGAVARTAGTTNSNRESLSKQFDELRTQIDQLAKDSGYNGVNLLNGDNLKIQFNESNTSSLTLTGASLNSTKLGVSASAGSFQSDADITNSLSQLDKATTAIRAQASTFGSNLSVVQNRQEFTKGLIDTLSAGADQLVVADANEEGAKLLSLNTRAQLSGTALSLASQADQAVLRLF